MAMFYSHQLKGVLALTLRVYPPKRQFSLSPIVKLSRPSQWDISAEPEGPKCHCGEPAVKFRVYKGFLHNRGREFFACRHPKDNPDNCDYFAWTDGTVAFGPEAWKRWGKTHGRTDWKEEMRQHWANTPEEEIPEVVRKALAEDSEDEGVSQD